MDTFEHSHPHTHTHAQGQTPAHGHDHDHGTNQDEKTALLHYMLAHNQQHLKELQGLTNSGNAQAEGFLSAAISYYEQANANLASYVEQLGAE